MAEDDHRAIRDYLDRSAQGKDTKGKKMVLNPVTGKFEVVSAHKAGAGDIAEVTAEDMRSFTAVTGGR